MATIIIKTEDKSEYTKRLINYLKGLKFVKMVKVEENNEYSPALLKRVKEAEDNVKKGKYKVVKNGDLWGSLNLR